MKDTIMLKIDIALLSATIAILTGVLSGLNVVWQAKRQAIVDSQKILHALDLIEQRLNHIEQRLDKTDNFIAQNSGFTGRDL
ncbi:MULTISPECIES: hypothetical protein [unclassified Microcoleus]|uniref:hypothetical protein n=1 Tax=unclassified Microcoleus TaxID=2642155 RepID=UPI001D2EB858|nr:MULTISPECIES: hypothetical protein [unclassified Microcoleus]MCC3445653.1 hypothetical protein [Microcoleus sp. PH2017_03_ELD_O_A]MCC3506544.1 hypothetical protein [Microcoleus sp. PH2017_19_SFW_U_A]MCC3526102.1 hypothetical protein [Microcoleus sp. PH2017_20_SFW_D_A]MCC3557023.1 hypothetical protein [Microcoleus sp. PH2017_35_SFW_U_B]MCC3569527.1 hypothetical protein [Microcoleus sp. PH2017_31_RDM_U_A]